MSARTPRFEVVQSDAGFFARFRAANGRIVWVTETFTRKRAADKAVGLAMSAWDPFTEVRVLDERTEATS